MRVAILTRLTPESEAKRVVAAIRTGTVDLVIGTHRLLSADLHYANLGLLVVDEEHKFGVMDKERIHAIRAGIDTLSLSATPIPRSLNFALSGMKELSILTTPPRAKKPIRTTVAPTDLATLAEAVSVELARGGQILAVTPRIMSMATIREMLRSVAPDLRIIETHGELPGTELEDRIVDFRERKYDCLLSTTVIENGVNFLSANTVVIFDSDHFGLAQLHQLRGRVGRADVEGRCYLLYPPEGLSAESKHRLSTLVAHSHLGAGFEIAMRDLQIRGAGDILGVRQSGHANEIGLSLYLQLLETRVKELRNDPDAKKKQRPVTIDLSIASYIPDEFFGSETDKLSFFRNLESLETEDDLRAAWRHFTSLAEEIPDELVNLFLLLAARIEFARLGIERVRKVLDSYTVDWYADAASIPAMKELLERDRRASGSVVSGTRLKFRTRAFRSDREFLAALVPEFEGIIKKSEE